MANEFFGNNSNLSLGYNNSIGKGKKPSAPKRRYPFNACGGGFSNCCGLAATGDEEMPVADLPLDAAPVVTTPIPALEPVNSSVQSMQTWQYAKTALALVGAWVILKYLFAKS